MSLQLAVLAIWGHQQVEVCGHLCGLCWLVAFNNLSQRTGCSVRYLLLVMFEAAASDPAGYVMADPECDYG